MTGYGPTVKGVGGRAPRMKVREDMPQQLTTRELQILSGLARGRNLRQIALDLFLGDSTIKTHTANLLAKSGCHGHAEVVSWGYRNGYMSGLKPEGRPAIELTPRELSVLQYTVLGLANEPIADRLMVSPGTVATYLSRLTTKFGAYNRTHIVALAWQMGLVKLTWWDDLGVAQPAPIRLYVPASDDYDGPYRCCPSCGTRTMPREVKTGKWMQDAMW